MKRIFRFLPAGLYLTLFLLMQVCGCSSKEAVYLEQTENTENSETEVTEHEEVVAASEAEWTAGEDGQCCVYICGAVKVPGIYLLPGGSRIYEVIEMAGGLRWDACESQINQAEYISDGQMIYIMTEEEVLEQEATDEQEAEENDGKINLNTATASELMTLAGIGQSKADAIIAYREENGGFSTIEELMNITGIKEGVFQKIKDSIKVN